MPKQPNHIFRDIESLEFQGKKDSLYLDTDIFKRALIRHDETLKKIEDAADNLFAILGMRNLSAFIGEVFVTCLEKESGGLFVKNPHQDGYPDLLVMTEEGKKLLKDLEHNMQDKHPFSDFATGGIEVKATCGSVPTPAVLRKKGLQKPEIGDPRIDLMRGYDWKAHHRQTNNLVGIVWDFINGRPAIVGLFFSGHLQEQDWGAIIHPKKGGGRTTSVSIMTRQGIKKMYDGWIAVWNDQRYIDFFNKFNGSNLIK